jgi:hypothetical protein
MRFQEPSAFEKVKPGWYCGNPDCGYRVFARAAPQSLEARRRSLVDRTAQAHRRAMTVIARADRIKKESARIRDSRPRRKK